MTRSGRCASDNVCIFIYYAEIRSCFLLSSIMQVVNTRFMVLHNIYRPSSHQPAKNSRSQSCRSSSACWACRHLCRPSRAAGHMHACGRCPPRVQGELHRQTRCCCCCCILWHYQLRHLCAGHLLQAPGACKLHCVPAMVILVRQASTVSKLTHQPQTRWCSDNQPQFPAAPTVKGHTVQAIDPGGLHCFSSVRHLQS